jgi:uncharacterized protein YlbG (UPF0298 family)
MEYAVQSQSIKKQIEYLRHSIRHFGNIQATLGMDKHIYSLMAVEISNLQNILVNLMEIDFLKSQKALFNKIQF